MSMASITKRTDELSEAAAAEFCKLRSDYLGRFHAVQKDVEALRKKTAARLKKLEAELNNYFSSEAFQALSDKEEIQLIETRQYLYTKTYSHLALGKRHRVQDIDVEDTRLNLSKVGKIDAGLAREILLIHWSDHRSKITVSDSEAKQLKNIIIADKPELQKLYDETQKLKKTLDEIESYYQPNLLDVFLNKSGCINA